MTIAYKVLGQLNPTANTLTTIYTVPSATESVLSTVTICNLNNVNANVRLAVCPGNAAIDNKHYVVYDNLLRNNDTLTLTLARWFSPAVRVNTVCPGFIQTRWLLGGMGEENYNKMKTGQEQNTPLRQAGTPEQMAEAVLFFLASASNITGEFLIVDAGMHLASLPMKAR